MNTFVYPDVVEVCKWIHAYPGDPSSTFEVIYQHIDGFGKETMGYQERLRAHSKNFIRI